MALHLKNANGDAVDPVPWIVVTGIAFLFCYAYLPLVILELSLGIDVALLISTVLFVGTAIAAYREQILRARPDLAAEIPAHHRVRRLVLAILIGIIVLIALQILMVLV